MNSKRPKPFLKWAGGKTQLISKISSKFAYNTDDSFVYIEPFVGSGAVLFWVLNSEAFMRKRSAQIEYKTAQFRCKQSWRNDCLKAVSAFANQETCSLLKSFILPDLLNPGGMGP